jgi:hypothetical protein
MAQRVYIYNKTGNDETGNDITSMSRIAPGLDSVEYDLEFLNGKILNVSDKRTSNIEPIVTFQRDVNDEVIKFILHKDKKEAIVKLANSDDYNEFYVRKSIISKESEYHSGRKEKLFHFHDEREIVNKIPISILREYNLENIDCRGKQAQIDLIRNYDTSLQIVPTYYDGKILNVLGYDQVNNLNFRVNYIYNSDDILIRIDEYSLRKTPLGNEQYLLDASFSLFYSNDRVAYITSTGTPYKKIELQYNSVGELSSVYKITTSKNLWFKVNKNYLTFSNNDITSFRFKGDKLQKSSIFGEAVLNFKYNVTKSFVNRFVVPGIITPDRTISNLFMYNIDMLGLQPNISEIEYIYKGVNIYKFIPEYKRGKIVTLGIHDFDSLTKLGYIKYFYSKNLISSIETYYYNKTDQPIWANTFVYDRNPYNPLDRTLIVEHDSAGVGEFKSGKYSFKMTKDNKIASIYDNYGKLEIGQVIYDKDNDVQEYTQYTLDFDINTDDLKLREYYELGDK